MIKDTSIKKTRFFNEEEIREKVKIIERFSKYLQDGLVDCNFFNVACLAIESMLSYNKNLEEAIISCGLPEKIIGFFANIHQESYMYVLLHCLNRVLVFLGKRVRFYVSDDFYRQIFFIFVPEAQTFLEIYRDSIKVYMHAIKIINTLIKLDESYFDNFVVRDYFSYCISFLNNPIYDRINKSITKLLKHALSHRQYVFNDSSSLAELYKRYDKLVLSYDYDVFFEISEHYCSLGFDHLEFFFSFVPIASFFNDVLFNCNTYSLKKPFGIVFQLLSYPDTKLSQEFAKSINWIEMCRLFSEIQQSSNLLNYFYKTITAFTKHFPHCIPNECYQVFFHYPNNSMFSCKESYSEAFFSVIFLGYYDITNILIEYNDIGQNVSTILQSDNEVLISSMLDSLRLMLNNETKYSINNSEYRDQIVDLFDNILLNSSSLVIKSKENIIQLILDSFHN